MLGFASLFGGGKSNDPATSPSPLPPPASTPVPSTPIAPPPPETPLPSMDSAPETNVVQDTPTPLTPPPAAPNTPGNMEASLSTGSLDLSGLMNAPVTTRVDTVQAPAFSASPTDTIMPPPAAPTPVNEPSLAIGGMETSAPAAPLTPPTPLPTPEDNSLPPLPLAENSPAANSGWPATVTEEVKHLLDQNIEKEKEVVAEEEAILERHQTALEDEKKKWEEMRLAISEHEKKIAVAEKEIQERTSQLEEHKNLINKAVEDLQGTKKEASSSQPTAEGSSD